MSSFFLFLLINDMFNTMKNFDEYIIEKLKITNKKILTLGDVYKFTKIESNAYVDSHPKRFLEKVDEVFGINKLYNIRNNYPDYFKEYKDNCEPKINGEDAKELCKILLNIIFSVPADMTIQDGLNILLDDCNISQYERELFKLESNSTLFFTNYLLVHFNYEER